MGALHNGRLPTQVRPTVPKGHVLPRSWKGGRTTMAAFPPPDERHKVREERERKIVGQFQVGAHHNGRFPTETSPQGRRFA